jgi:hypothetical protein
MATVAQQEAGQLLTRLAQGAHRRLTRSDTQPRRKRRSSPQKQVRGRRCRPWQIVESSLPFFLVLYSNAMRLRHSATTHGSGTRMRRREITDRLVGLIRNPDRGQFTGAVQLGKINRIPPVSLDPLAWLSRDQRWRDGPAS